MTTLSPEPVQVPKSRGDFIRPIPLREWLCFGWSAAVVISLQARGYSAGAMILLEMTGLLVLVQIFLRVPFVRNLPSRFVWMLTSPWGLGLLIASAL